MRWIIATLILIVLSANACADNGTIQLEEFTNRIIYSSELDRVIFIQFNEEIEKSLLKICNPLDFTEEKLIVLDDFIDNIFYLKSSGLLLVFADQSDERGYIESGALRKIDFKTGEILAGIEFDKNFNSLFVDHNQKTAFVYSGYETATLYKIDIEDFEVVADISQRGQCDAIAISLNDRKIYISDKSNFTVPSPNTEESSSGRPYSYGPKQMFYAISVYDTQDLTHLTSIMTIMSSSQLFMLDDGRLFFLGECYHEQDPSPDMMVVDTQTDEIVEILDLGEPMIDEVTIDKRHHKIFATTNMKDLINSPFPEYPNYLDTGIVLEINLDDYSHRFIEVSDKPLVNIIAVPTDTGTRLFCMEKREDEDADVFLRYYDVE